jgi:metal-responsive CopG/Arc/MetJ family transcriptional regulator
LTTKVYGFSTEPKAFSHVIEILDEIAIKKHTSRSEVIVEILSNYVGLDHKRSLRRMDYSGVLSGRQEK